MANLPWSASFEGVVLDAEELAEVEPGLVDVFVVVLDEAGALAHHPLAEPVHELRVVLVVGDGQQPGALVVPGQGVGVVLRPRFAHGGGERGEGGLGQQALVVAPGAGVRFVGDGDMVARLAVVEPADQAAMCSPTSMASRLRSMKSSSRVSGASTRGRRGRRRASAWRRRGSAPARRICAKGVSPAGRCVTHQCMGVLLHWVLAAAQRMKAGERWRAGSRRTQAPTSDSPTSRRSRVA